MIAGAARSGFDTLADQYDRIWSLAPAGVHQRHAVWQSVRPLFRPGERILDLGCGTGVDALFLMATGVEVEGIDASAEMVRVAQSRGVQASQRRIEDLTDLAGHYDGVISNFGVLNCVSNLDATAAALARLVRCGGYVAICVMGAFCLWETVHFLRSGQWGRAARRWLGGSRQTSLGVNVQYPRVSTIARSFEPYFRLVSWEGIGMLVPPSYVRNISPRRMELFARVDAAIGASPLVRALADHRLLIFSRI